MGSLVEAKTESFCNHCWRLDIHIYVSMERVGFGSFALFTSSSWVRGIAWSSSLSRKECCRLGKRVEANSENSTYIVNKNNVMRHLCYSYTSITVPMHLHSSIILLLRTTGPHHRRLLERVTAPSSASAYKTTHFKLVHGEDESLPENITAPR